MKTNSVSSVLFGLVLAAGCSSSAPSGDGCVTEQDCDSGEICFEENCRSLCNNEDLCGDGLACSEGVCLPCEGCSGDGPPQVISVDGTGDEAASGRHAVFDSLVLNGNNLGGASVTLSGGLYDGEPLLACGAGTPSRIEVELPSDLVPDGSYTLTVTNQAGSCDASVSLLEGPAGAPGSFTAGEGLQIVGDEISVVFGNNAYTVAEGNDARFHNRYTDNEARAASQTQRQLFAAQNSLLGNGNFGIWQRGTSTMPDLWYASDANITGLRDNTVPGRSNVLELTSTDVTAFAFQKIAGATNYAGRDITLSIDAGGSTGGNAIVEIDDGVSQSSVGILPGALLRLTVNHTIAAAPTRLAVRIYPGTTAPGTVQVDSASLALGDLEEIPFIPLPAGENRRRAQLYYQTADDVLLSGSGIASAPIGTVFLKGWMAGTPTITLNPATCSHYSTVTDGCSVGSVKRYQFRMSATGTGSQGYQRISFDYTAEVPVTY